MLGIIYIDLREFLMGPQQITDRIWRVGGSDMTDARDSAVYLIDLGEPVLVDCGSGHGFESLIVNIGKAGFRPHDIKTLIMTHCHVDHIGAAHILRSHFGTQLVMHEKDADIVERGDTRLTAAFCFDVDFKPLPVDMRLKGDEGNLEPAGHPIRWIHTPGHTPGSISLYMEDNGERILFAQDIGAPLLSEFDCDPKAWFSSIKKLFALEADILCDGHSGAYGPKHAAREYLEYCLAAQYQNGYLDTVKSDR
ncbi:MAG: zn-dependent hydrolase including glyoxylase [Deltaproteobacteria bacterium]|nr:zn-dependent hydrolase including glyoxylase [Deltaproteobacteria bacterium]